MSLPASHSQLLLVYRAEILPSHGDDLPMLCTFPPLARGILPSATLYFVINTKLRLVRFYFFRRAPSLRLGSGWLRGSGA